MLWPKLTKLFILLIASNLALAIVSTGTHFIERDEVISGVRTKVIYFLNEQFSYEPLTKLKFEQFTDLQKTKWRDYLLAKQIAYDDLITSTDPDEVFEATRSIMPHNQYISVHHIYWIDAMAEVMAQVEYLKITTGGCNSPSLNTLSPLAEDQWSGNEYYPQCLSLNPYMLQEMQQRYLHYLEELDATTFINFFINDSYAFNDGANARTADLITTSTINSLAAGASSSGTGTRSVESLASELCETIGGIADINQQACESDQSCTLNKAKSIGQIAEANHQAHRDGLEVSAEAQRQERTGARFLGVALEPDPPKVRRAQEQIGLVHEAPSAAERESRRSDPEARVRRREREIESRVGPRGNRRRKHHRTDGLVAQAVADFNGRVLNDLQQEGENPPNAPEGLLTDKDGHLETPIPEEPSPNDPLLGETSESDDDNALTSSSPGASRALLESRKTRIMYELSQKDPNYEVEQVMITEDGRMSETRRVTVGAYLANSNLYGSTPLNTISYEDISDETERVEKMSQDVTIEASRRGITINQEEAVEIAQNYVASKQKQINYDQLFNKPGTQEVSPQTQQAIIADQQTNFANAREIANVRQQLRSSNISSAHRRRLIAKIKKFRSRASSTDRSQPHSRVARDVDSGSTGRSTRDRARGSSRRDRTQRSPSSRPSAASAVVSRSGPNASGNYAAAASATTSMGSSGPSTVVGSSDPANFSSFSHSAPESSTSSSERTSRTDESVDESSVEAAETIAQTPASAIRKSGGTSAAQISSGATIGGATRAPASTSEHSPTAKNHIVFSQIPDEEKNYIRGLLTTYLNHYQSDLDPNSLANATNRYVSSDNGNVEINSSIFEENDMNLVKATVLSTLINEDMPDQISFRLDDVLIPFVFRIEGTTRGFIPLHPLSEEQQRLFTPEKLQDLSQL